MGWYCHGKWKLLCSNAFCICKWAGFSCPSPPAPPWIPSRKGKGAWGVVSPPLSFTADLICGDMRPQHRLASLLRLYYMSFTFYFLHYRAFSTKDSQGEARSCTSRISCAFSQHCKICLLQQYQASSDSFYNWDCSYEIFICLMTGRVRCKKSCLEHVSLYSSINHQFVLLVIFAMPSRRRYFFFYYFIFCMPVIYLYFCSNCFIVLNIKNKFFDF